MLKFKQHMKEEYHSLMNSPIDKRKYPIFKNPDKSEIKELAKDTNLVRFISHKGDFYVFNGSLLHSHAIKHIGLPISDDPPIKDAFLGIAKASTNGKMEFYDSNQKDAKNPKDVMKYHEHIMKYLS